jgi:hypothetical protein
VVPPTRGCYNGVVVIDGNSLYGSLMANLKIFVDRCMYATTFDPLTKVLSVNLPNNFETVEVDDVMWHSSSNPIVVVMRNKSKYMAVAQAGNASE